MADTGQSAIEGGGALMMEVAADSTPALAEATEQCEVSSTTDGLEMMPAPNMSSSTPTGGGNGNKKSTTTAASVAATAPQMARAGGVGKIHQFRAPQQCVQPKKKLWNKRQKCHHHLKYHAQQLQQQQLHHQQQQQQQTTASKADLENIQNIKNQIGHHRLPVGVCAACGIEAGNNNSQQVKNPKQQGYKKMLAHRSCNGGGGGCSACNGVGGSVNGAPPLAHHSVFCSRTKFFLPDKRPRKEVIIPPTKFLLGGNISDPLNLNSLQNEANSSNNNTPATTPRQSPITTPPKVEVIIPPNIHDPLHLLDPVDTMEYEKQLTSPMKRKSKSSKSKHRHRKKKTKRRRFESVNSTIDDSDMERCAPINSTLSTDLGNSSLASDCLSDAPHNSSAEFDDGTAASNEKSCSESAEEKALDGGVCIGAAHAHRAEKPTASASGGCVSGKVLPNLLPPTTTGGAAEADDHKSHSNSSATATSDRESVKKDLRLDLSGLAELQQSHAFNHHHQHQHNNSSMGGSGGGSIGSCGGRKRKVSEGACSAKNKFRRMDSMDKIVSPVVPQPGAWKRPPRLVPTGARKASRHRSTSGSELSKPIDKKFYKGTNPSCHDFNAHVATPSGAPLLVGFTTGQIQLVQPQPGPRELRKIYNEERLIDKTKVTCLKWLPRSPNLFLASHASGHLYLYNEELPCTPASPNYQPFKTGDGFTILTCKSKSTRNPLYKWVFGTENCSINEFCFSPCGSNLAIVSQDGFLRVFHYDTMELLGIARSYFGGFLCVCWSPDGKYIVVGGEDDLVTVWSLHERRVVARGQGHRSWVSVVAFDPYTTCYSNWDGGDFSDDENQMSEYSNHRYGSGSESNHGMEEKNSTPNSRHRPNSFRDSLAPDKLAISYRLGSVSQDTQLCLWDITEDVLRHPLTLRQRVNSANLNETANNTSGFTTATTNNSTAHLNGDLNHDVKLIKPVASTVINGSNPNSNIAKDHDSSNSSSKNSSNSSSGKFSTANCTISSSSSASANDTGGVASSPNLANSTEIVIANKSNCSNSSNSKSSSNPLKFPNCISATKSDQIDVGGSGSGVTGIALGNNINMKSSSGSSSTKSADSSLSAISTITQRLTNFNFFSGEKKSSSSSISSSSTTTVFDNQQNNHHNPQNQLSGGPATTGGRHNSHRKTASLFKSYASGSNSTGNHQTSYMTASNISNSSAGDGNGVNIGGTLKLGSKASTLQSPTSAIVTSYDPMKLIGTQSCPRFDECPLLEPLVCKKIAHERLTALIFREDCFLTACQDGFIYTWARPAYSSNVPQHMSPSPSAPPGGTVV